MRALIKKIKSQIKDSEKHLQKLAGEKDSKEKDEEREYLLSYINELHSLVDEMERHEKESNRITIFKKTGKYLF